MGNVTYPENIYVAVWGESDFEESELPVDYAASVEYVLNAALTERTRAVVRMRYKDGLTYEKIGKEFNVTLERVRQIEHKAIRVISHPKWSRFLKHGVIGVMRIQAEQAAMAQDAKIRPYERIFVRAEFLKALDETLRKLNIRDRLGLETAQEQKQEDDPREITLEELDLSVRAYNCLSRAGARTVGDIVAMDAERFLSVRNLGRKSAEEVVKALERHGIKAYHLRKAIYGIEGCL